MQSTNCTEPWRVLATWDSDRRLVHALDSAFAELDGIEDGTVVFDYVDPEAIEAALGHRSNGPGADQLTFTCERYEFRVGDDGTVAVRERS